MDNYHHGIQKPNPQSSTLHCSYDLVYESIYGPSYDVGFIFYDEEELDDDSCLYQEDIFFNQLH